MSQSTSKPPKVRLCCPKGHRQLTPLGGIEGMYWCVACTYAYDELELQYVNFRLEVAPCPDCAKIMAYFPKNQTYQCYACNTTYTAKHMHQALEEFRLNRARQAQAEAQATPQPQWEPNWERVTAQATEIIREADLKALQEKMERYMRGYTPEPKLNMRTFAAQTVVEYVGGPMDGGKAYKTDDMIQKGSEYRYTLAWPVGAYYGLEVLDSKLVLCYYGAEDVD